MQDDRRPESPSGPKFDVVSSKLEKIQEIVLADAYDDNDGDDESAEAYLENVLSHGCVSGMVPSLTYYADTNAFYEKHKEEIWDALYDYAEGQGEDILTYISNLNGAKDVGSEEQFFNLLAWWAYEAAAGIILEGKDE